jgi:uncharacterized RmlC-like cupin family protein
MARKSAKKTTARKQSRAAAKSTTRKVSKSGKATKARKVARKAAAARKPARKVAKKSPAKSARRSPARKPVAKARSTARRARSAPAAVAKPVRPPQRVAVSHYNNSDFESGLRTYAQYRDLGIVEATHGMVRAHVLRFVEPCDPAVVSKLHLHDTEFQMVYVLKGWVKTELEGEGEITMRAGSAWTQPPKIRHKINDYSEDAELLEVILPADFETEELAG